MTLQAYSSSVGTSTCYPCKNHTWPESKMTEVIALALNTKMLHCDKLVKNTVGTSTCYPCKSHTWPESEMTDHRTGTEHKNVSL